jgi:hypothetical protein
MPMTQKNQHSHRPAYAGKYPQNSTENYGTKRFVRFHVKYYLLNSNKYYEHLRTVREILIKEQQQRSLQEKLDSFFKPALLRSKTSTTSESSIDE